MAMMANCAPTRGHAMMAEIERLVDAYKGAMLNYERDNCTHYRNKENAAKAALMAAIQRHIQE